MYNISAHYLEWPTDVHCPLKDFLEQSTTMSGTQILLAGYFCQTFPIIPRSSAISELTAFLESWTYVNMVRLSTNICVHFIQDASAQTIAKQLLNMGDLKLTVDPTVCTTGDLIPTILLSISVINDGDLKGIFSRTSPITLGTL